MADYIRINNYSNKGKMGISRKALCTITEHAVNSIPGASVNSAKKKKSKSTFSVSGPVKIAMRKTGVTEISIDVVIAHGVKVMDICQSIQEEVTKAIQMTCETVPVQVSVNVTDVEN